MWARGRSTLASLAQLVTALLISDDTPGGCRGDSVHLLCPGGISPTDSFFAFFARLLEVLVWFWPLVRPSTVLNNLPTWCQHGHYRNACGELWLPDSWHCLYSLSIKYSGKQSQFLLFAVCARIQTFYCALILPLSLSAKIKVIR